MGKQRNHNNAEFKTKVDIAAIKGQQPVNEIAAAYGVHPNQVTQWKKQVLESMPAVFSTRRARAAQNEEELKARHYQEIGQLKMELEMIDGSKCRPLNMD